MKHATEIKFKDLKQGDMFTYTRVTSDGDFKTVATVTSISSTKTGRINLITDKGAWTNGAAHPDRYLQTS